MPRVGLVLGAGGLTGTAFHAGVLTALADEIGWDARGADVVVGTSAGSTAAALMRSGFPPRDYVPRVVGLPMSEEGAAILGGMPPLVDPPVQDDRTRVPAAPDLVRTMARRPWAYRPGVLAAGLLPPGRRHVTSTGASLAGLFPRWPDEPLWICAVGLADGARVVFGRDAQAAVGDAVSASCAVPGYFQPVVIDGRGYVDGAAYSIVNADIVAGLHLDVVVVSAPMSTTDWAARDPGNLTRVPARLQLDRELAAVRRSGARVVVVQPDLRMRMIMGTNSMVAAKRRPVALAAREYAAAALRGAPLR